jgi:Fic family protein
MHYQFEAIHPFVDGNGRVGRLLITCFLQERGVLSQPLLYLSAFFERYRDDYYRHLLGVSQKGAYREWIAFFLRGVATQAQDGLAEATRIVALHKRYREMVNGKRMPQAALKLVDHLFTNPMVSVTQLSKAWKMPFPTVSKGVEKLVALGILEEKTGQKRNKVYVAKELMKLIGTGT